MRRFRLIGSLPIMTVLSLAFARTSVAQDIARAGSVVIPQSSVARVADIGVRSHTNIMIKAVHGSPEEELLRSQSFAVGAPPFAEFGFETPASLGCIYRLVSTIVAGCNPNTVTENPTGGSRMIALVDAYDDPDAMSDLNEFSSQFGLPAVNSTTFEVVYATGSKPAQDSTGGWEAEESLDIEMAHAMAPDAKIILVEAASSQNSDLYAAVTLAGNRVAAAGGGEVSMGWGSPEFSGETSYDTVFTTPGVVYVASVGDSPGTEYPSVSPNVVAAGGTTVRRDPFTYELIGQGVWQETAGGPSSYELRPAYQNAIKSAFPSVVRTRRGVPDLSFDSDIDTGVWIYESFPITDAGGGVDGSNWYIFGGTSVAAPALAGIINIGGHFAASSALELTRIYNHITFTTDFRDLASGNCGPYDGFSAVAGWDYCTGVGTPVGYAGK
jgi:kumamolisin